MDYAGYDMEEYDIFDFFEVNDALFRAAKANHIKLDMSEHENKVEGLPFNLDFIVINKKAQIKCPYCGNKSNASILYGYPAFNDDLAEEFGFREDIPWRMLHRHGRG